MRGKISDQDLTNYALNDGMDPHERLYVESMLAVSEECRQDVYRGIDLAQMLEEGFEAQSGVQTPSLTATQRAALVRPRHSFNTMAFVHRTAATLAIAACAAFVLANPSLWQVETHRRSLAAVSSHVSQVISGDTDSEIASYVNIPTVGDEVDSFIQTASDAMPQPSAICTPPTLDTSEFVDLR